MPERTVLAEAMRHAIGKASPEAVEDAFRRQEFVFGEREGRRMVTTREVLDEEMRMLAFARDGRGTEAKLANKPHVFRPRVAQSGPAAGGAARLGIAGSGHHGIREQPAWAKRAMMQEAVDAIEAGGKRVFTFAPSAEASRGVLRGEGFEDADTVARLLMDTRLHEAMKGQVIWIDEAGLTRHENNGRRLRPGGKARRPRDTLRRPAAARLGRARCDATAAGGRGRRSARRNQGHPAAAGAATWRLCKALSRRPDGGRL